MATLFTVRIKSALNSIPKDYKLQVLASSSSCVTTKELENALVKEGFPANHAHAIANHSSYWEIVKR